jgi:hypothetical protein
MEVTEVIAIGKLPLFAAIGNPQWDLVAIEISNQKFTTIGNR